MTLGALEALTLSTAVIQFIDFAAKVVSKGHKLYRSHEGNLLEYSDLDASARQILKLNNAVIDGFDTARKTDPYDSGGSIPLGQEEDLKKVCRSCNLAATQLHNALESLKVQGRRSKWRSFRAAIKSEWGKAAVDSMKNELAWQRNLLDTSLLVSLRYNMRDVLKLLQSSRTRPPWQKKLAQKVQVDELKDSNKGHIGQFGLELSAVARSASTEQMQLQILQQLDFRDRLDRHNRINSAHKETFQWIFASQQQLAKKDFKSFADWLKSSDNLYWITGKPGSGKSTLMKFIVSDIRTRKHLNVWSGGRRLVSASFYFWNSGSDVQMSLLGLLRTLLCELLYACPQLVPEAFPARWAQTSLVGEAVQPWTEDELLRVLGYVVVELTRSSNVCLFIDGLDEFSGRHEQLNQIVNELLANPNVKICLSSRPWPVFDDAYGRRASLMLQNLTFDDIKRYAKAMLCGSRGFEALQQSEPVYASKLMDQIAEKAQGVYLWVSLVVKSLLEGMTNRDRISDLERRLAETPGDLEELYQSMLDSIEPFYLGHASQLFQIVRESKGDVTALTLSFADEEFAVALEAAIEPMSDEEKGQRFETMKSRLISRCKGFLEIPTFATTEYALANTVVTVEPAQSSGTPAEEELLEKRSIERGLGQDLCPTRSCQGMRRTLKSTSLSPLESTSALEEGDQGLTDHSATTAEVSPLSEPVHPMTRRRMLNAYERGFITAGSISESATSGTSGGPDHESLSDSSEDEPFHLLHAKQPFPTHVRPPRGPPSRREMAIRRMAGIAAIAAEEGITTIPSASELTTTPMLSFGGAYVPDAQQVPSKPELRHEPFNPENDGSASLADRKIAYLHRTARDFLEKEDVWAQVRGHSPSKFVSYTAILASLIRQLKSVSRDSKGAATMSECVHRTLSYIAHLESSGIVFEKWWSELEEVIRVSIEQCRSDWANDQSDRTIAEIGKNGERGFHVLAAEYPLHGFIQRKLSQGLLIFPDQENRSLLDCVVADYKAYACLCAPSAPSDSLVPDITLIRQLLSSGEDPNHSYEDRTPWGLVLKEAVCVQADDTLDPQVKRKTLLFWADIVEEFIKNGGNPYENRNANNGNAIRAAFGATLPQRSRQMEDRLEKSKKKLSRLGKFFTPSHSFKSTVDTMPLFRFRQMQKAQIPGLSHAEHFRTKPGKAKKGEDTALKPFIH